MQHPLVPKGTFNLISVWLFLKSFISLHGERKLGVIRNYSLSCLTVSGAAYGSSKYSFCLKANQKNGSLRLDPIQLSKLLGKAAFSMCKVKGLDPMSL